MGKAWETNIVKTGGEASPERRQCGGSEQQRTKATENLVKCQTYHSLGLGRLWTSYLASLPPNFFILKAGAGPEWLVDLESLAGIMLLLSL